MSRLERVSNKLHQSQELSTKVLRIFIPALLAVQLSALALKDTSSPNPHLITPVDASPARQMDRLPEMAPPSAAQPAPEVSPTTLPLEPFTKEVALEGLTPSELERLMANQTYIHTTLVPQLEKAQLVIVPPINEEVEIVNLPNQFIVSEDGLYGSQFALEDVADPTVKNVAVVAYGKLAILADGNEYHDAVFAGPLEHQEGEQMDGRNFASSDPISIQEAVQFIVETNKKVTQAMAANEHRYNGPDAS